MGTSWKTNSWAATAWHTGTWANLGSAGTWVLRHINSRMQTYLRNTVGYSSQDLGWNLSRYLAGSPDATARWTGLMRLAANS